MIEPHVRRLLIVSHGYPPYYGGAEHAAEQLAKAAAATGRWQVEVLTSDIGGRLSSQEVAGDVLISRVRTWKRAWTHHSVPELISFLRATHAWRPKARPDLVMAHFSLPGGAVARRLARKAGVPYMVVLHGSDVPHYQDERFGLLYQLTKPWTRLIWRNAQRVVAVSSGLRDLALRSWPAGKITVIPNGVDTERFSPAKERKPVLGPLRIVVNAQLIKRKGIHVLLRALASLPMTLRAEWSLRVFGVGPYAHALQRLAGQLALSDQVSFCGLVPYADIPARLREADLFILPSLQEGMPLALLEAMACGLPVLSTEVGAIPGIVRDHGNGRLVKPGDEAGLATVLAEMLQQRQRLVEMGRVARETAMRWSWEMIWSRYEVLAEESLSATGFS